ncbi:DUF3822 family protein [Pontibacter sp. H249]|uniref:DUF3822 family protein n=1 Tax=Pontibacter sp. H249 TaxID=3133420 RepID=UPI0030BDB469
MNTTSIHFRLSHKIQDEAFSLAQVSTCNLYISVSHKAIRLAVVDTNRNKFVVLQDYELISVFNPQQIAEQLLLIATDSPLLQEKNWLTVRVSVSNQHFTLVPETLYDPEHQVDYLRLHAQVNHHEVIMAYRHNGLEAMNIFAIDAAIHEAILYTFPERQVQFVHQTSALTKSILMQADRTARKIYAFIERNYVTVLVAGPAGLEFCNIFHYLSPEDFIYYVVFVMQEMKLNPEQETITVWGDITHDSTLFSTLQKYIRNVKLGKKPADVEYSYKFQDLFEHRYFELYSMHLCE